jgi:hypothetical protein
MASFGAAMERCFFRGSYGELAVAALHALFFAPALFSVDNVVFRACCVIIRKTSKRENKHVWRRGSSCLAAA